MHWEFTTGFVHLDGKRRKSFSQKYDHLFAEDIWRYKWARGRGTGEENGRRIILPILVIEAEFLDNGVKIRYELEKGDKTYIHLIESGETNAFGTRRAIKAFQKYNLDLNNKLYAYGRSGPNQYAKEEGWRWEKKGIYDKLTFYWLRQGFFDVDEVHGEYRYIYLPSTAYELQMKTDSPDAVQRATRFKHRNYENY